MLIKQVVNPSFNSNTYIISEATSNWTWLIDIGEIEGVLNLIPEGTIIKGSFLTHPHYDHIYGINKLIDMFPDCTIYTSEQGKEGLFSEKLNLSYYHETPIIFKGSDIKILHEADRVEIFGNIFLDTLETPGHNPACLSYRIDQYLFTGDSYIPGANVVTRLKGGDRDEARKSLKKIMDNTSTNTIICPGHGKMKQINSHRQSNEMSVIIGDDHKRKL